MLFRKKAWQSAPNSVYRMVGFIGSNCLKNTTQPQRFDRRAFVIPLRRSCSTVTCSTVTYLNILKTLNQLSHFHLESSNHFLSHIAADMHFQAPRIK